MPNWCENVLEVTAPSPEKLEELKDLLLSDEGDFTFAKTVPAPDDIYQGPLGSKEREEYGEKNWYDWNIANWGSKWDASDSSVDINEHTIRIAFETAWAPPEAWLISTSSIIPDSEFTLIYSEPGMSFSGFSRYLNGELLEEEHYDEVNYSIWLKMGYDVESYADYVIDSPSLVEDIIADETSDLTLVDAIVQASEVRDEDDRPSEALIEKAKLRLASGN